MLLKQTIHKSRSLVKKTIRNLKCFFFGRYQKLPKSFSFNSFSLSKKLKNCKTDQIYTELYEEWEVQLDEIGRREKIEEPPMKEEEENGIEGALKSKKEAVSKEKKRNGDSQRQGSGKKSNPKETGQVLAQRMKELEVVDSGDMEQALDIEEAIHYYSRLKSPVYLDIVDKFFVDMYTELSVPHNPSAKINKHSATKINSSKRRLSSFRL